MKPLCFASPSVSAADDQCCKCPHRAACAEGAFAFMDKHRGKSQNIEAERQRLAKVSEQFAAEQPAPAPAAPVAPVTPAPEQLAPQIAIKGARRKTTGAMSTARDKTIKRAVERREVSGVSALQARELKKGINPGKKAWEVVFFEQLLFFGHITQSELTLAFQKDPRTAYTPASARSRATRAIKTLEEALLIYREGGFIALHPRVTQDHFSTNTNDLP